MLALAGLRVEGEVAQVLAVSQPARYREPLRRGGRASPMTMAFPQVVLKKWGKACQIHPCLSVAKRLV